MNFILFVLATIGLTNIVVHGKILDATGIRPLLKEKLPSGAYSAFECYECMGTWCGFICGSLLVSFNPIIIIMCGLAGGVITQTYTDLIYWVRSKTDFVLPEEDNG